LYARDQLRHEGKNALGWNRTINLSVSMVSNTPHHIILVMFLYIVLFVNTLFDKKCCKNTLLKKVLQKYTFKKSVAKIHRIWGLKGRIPFGQAKQTPLSAT
jgi:hypothetical protein